MYIQKKEEYIIIYMFIDARGSVDTIVHVLMWNSGNSIDIYWLKWDQVNLLWPKIDFNL